VKIRNKGRNGFRKVKSVRETEGGEGMGKGETEDETLGKKDGDRGKESESILKRKLGISFLKDQENLKGWLQSEVQRL
jgi:hypothetical protein